MSVKNRIFSLRWLTFALVLTTMVSTVTLSRYVTNISGAGIAQVAQFDVQMTANKADGKTFAGSFHEKDFDTYTYDFSITSNSDVAVDYDITVSFHNGDTYLSIPENITLNIDEEPGRTANDGYSFLFEGFSFPVGEKTNRHTLTITAKYMDANGAIVFEKITEAAVSITVEARQTDPASE